jgi:VanZ family protein
LSDPSHPTPPRAGAPFDRSLAAVYALLLVYGTLYPLSGWQAPVAGLGAALADSLGKPASRADVLFNVLIYIPFGLLGMRLLPGGRGAARRVLEVGLAGAAASLCLESLQGFLPARSASLVDVLANGLGAFAGAGAGAVLRTPTGIGAWLKALWADQVRPGAASAVGWWAVGLWAAAQLSPFVPSPDWGNLKLGARPLWHALTGQRGAYPSEAAAYALAVAALALVLRTVLRPGARPWAWAAALVTAVLALKVPILTRQLTLDAVAGATIGLAAAAALARMREGAVLAAAGALAVLAAAAERLAPGFGVVHPAFNWVPFGGQMGGVEGLSDVLDAMWPYLALAYVALRLRPFSPGRTAAVGAVLVGAFALGVEGLQGFVPGRFPDVTDPLLAVAAWLAPWLHPAVRRESGPVV